jgi:flavin reductase (DIM6/NTAB) family NADH-FMN oxidoreductase RutF
MKIIPGQVPTPKLQGYLQGAVGPRPIAFASTVDNQGRPNLSPFSFFNLFSTNPATLIFSPSRRVRDNTTKHTLENARQTGEVVINVVNYAIVQQASLSSVEYPEGVNEFTKAGLTPIESELVKPFRVKESPVQFECKVKEIIELGTEGGAGNLIVCEVLLMHINDDVLDANGHIDPFKIDLVARMGNNWYCRANGDALFEVTKPVTTIGIGVDAIPDKIRFSPILTGNNLGQLGNVEQLPTADEVEAYKQHGAILELYEDYKNSREGLEIHLHTVAKGLLDQNKVEEAWKVLLCSL